MMKHSLNTGLAGFSFLLLTLLIVLGCQQRHSEVNATADAPTQAAAPDLVPNQRQPLPGVTSGGQPTLAQLEVAQAAGYRSVINLRLPDERGTDDEAQQVTALGMDYIALPIAGADALTEENVRLFAQLLDTAEPPVLLHCSSGNRVGALFALRAAYLEGKSPAEALGIGLDAGLTRLEPAVAEKLAAQIP